MVSLLFPPTCLKGGLFWFFDLFWPFLLLCLSVLSYFVEFLK